MKKPVLRSKVPTLDSLDNVQDIFNQMAKVLNSSFSDEDRILVTGSFSNISGVSADVSVTFSHPFKSAPTAAIVSGCLSGNYYYNNFMPSYRVSNSDDNSITITMRQNASSTDTFSFLIFK